MVKKDISTICFIGLAMASLSSLDAAEPRQDKQVVAQQKVLTEAEKKRVKELEAKLTEVGYFEWVVLSTRALRSSIKNRQMEAELLVLKNATMRLELGLRKQKKMLMDLALEDSEEAIKEAKKFEANMKIAKANLEEGQLVLEQRERMFKNHCESTKQLNASEEKLREKLLEKSELVNKWMAELRLLKGEEAPEQKLGEPKDKGSSAKAGKASQEKG